MRFLINFIKALAVFVAYGIGTYLIAEFLKPYNISPWIPFGLLVICICALYASWVCHVERTK
jgi:hypothetical protein